MANVSSQIGLNIFVRTHTCYLSFAIAAETVTLWSGTYEEVPDGHKAYTNSKFVLIHFCLRACEGAIIVRSSLPFDHDDDEVEDGDSDKNRLLRSS